MTKRGVKRGPNDGRSRLRFHGAHGNEHQLQRKRLAPIVARGAVRCTKCGQRIQPGEPWNLAHAHLPRAHELGLYAGPQHARCNRATNTGQQRKQTTLPRPKALAVFDTPPRRRDAG
jgi:hypothetical protein